MIQYFIAPHTSYKFFPLSLLIMIGNWFVGHVLEYTWTACMLYPVLRHLWLFFSSKNQAPLALQLNQEGVNVALALWTFAIPRWDSHRRLCPDTFVARPCSQAVGQCIFSLTFMGHRTSPLTSRHVQHWQQLDEQSSCIFHWWWSGEG